MSQPGRRPRTALAVGVMVIGVAVLAGPSQSEIESEELVAVGSTSNNANPGCNGKTNGSCSGSGHVKAFRLNLGEIPLMYPGSSSGLTVSFGNPEAFDIRVETITVTAELNDVAEDCPLSSLVFPSGTLKYSPAIVVPARGTVAATSLAVGLSSAADESCERAGFTIRALATAVKK